MRRVCACVCAALLWCAVLPLGGCAGDTAVAYAPETYQAEFADAWRYSLLEPHLQACYGALYTAVTETVGQSVSVTAEGQQRYGVSVRLPVPLADEQEACALFEAFTADQPRFFFLDNTFTYSGEPNAYTVFTLLYLCDAPERTAAAAALEAAVDAAVKTCPTQDEFAAELYLHDYLANVCTYDDATAAAPDAGDALAFTAYGALVKGTAVCEGYSRAVQLLLARVGIDATLVVGTAPDTGVSHMWNMVRIDGETYHVDATWNDSGDRLHHRYFNLTDEAIALSRRVPSQGLPACTALSAQYYRRNGRYIDTFDREAIAGVIAEAVRGGQREIELCFAPDKYANGALLLSNTPLLVDMVCRQLRGDVAFSDYQLSGKPEEYILSVLW